MGAGNAAEEIMEFIGWANIECFCDNFKKETVFLEKKVISFEEFLTYDLENFIVIVAAHDRACELESQLIN